MSHPNTTTSSPSRSNDRPVMRPQGGRLDPFISGRLVAGATALVALLSSCNDAGEYTGPTLVSNGDANASGAETKGIDGGAIENPLDVTGTSDDAADIPTDATRDANEELDIEDAQMAVDATSGVDGVNDSTDDAAGTATDATATDAMAETADAKAVEVKASETAQPKTPEEICEAKKKAIIAALNPGEPECTQVIPQIGKKAGELVCSGTNQDPNCVVK